MSRVKLGDVVFRIKDFVDKDNTELEFYVGGEHFDNRSLLVKKRGIIAGSTIGPAFNTRFKPGDVLLMSRNPHLRKAGKVDFEGICSDVSYVIRTKNEKMLKQAFIPLLFQSDAFWRFAEKNKKGSTNFFLNWSDFERFEFDLPSIDAQERLCNLIWSLNDTYESYLTMLEQNKIIIRSRFIELFGTIDLSEQKEDWKALEELTEIVTGTTPSTKDDSNWGGDVLWVTPAELNDESFYVFDTERKITEKGKKSKALDYMPTGTVLLSSRAPIGKTAICGKPMTCNQGFKNFICGKKINPVFLYVIFKNNTQYLNSIGTGTTFLELSKSRIAKTKIPVPELKIQDEFADFVTSIKEMDVNLRKGLEKLNKIRNEILNENIPLEE